ncbi:MAG: hypothetical protein GY801_45015 [bacterium]|nr:hypothetical protein [bacterium]
MSGQEFLAWLEQTNLFIIALDSRQQWFRYHRVFQKFLLYRVRERQSPEDITGLHARAAAWFAEHDFIDEALHHALTAGDIPSATRLVAQHRHELMNRERWPQLERWLNRFPREILEHSPELLAAKAWIYTIQARLPEVISLLERIEPQLAEMDDSASAPLQGEILTMRSNIVAWTGDVGEAAAFAKQALERFPMERQFAHSGAILVLAAGLFSMGEVRSAYTELYRVLDDEQLRERAHPTLLLFMLCILRWVDSNLIRLAACRDTLPEGRHEPKTAGEHGPGPLLSGNAPLSPE